MADVRRVTARVAEAYAGKTPKTVARDIVSLVRLHLVQVDSGRVRANRELILGFLPMAARGAKAAPAAANEQGERARKLLHQIAPDVREAIADEESLRDDIDDGDA